MPLQVRRFLLRRRTCWLTSSRQLAETVRSQLALVRLQVSSNATTTGRCRQLIHHSRRPCSVLSRSDSRSRESASEGRAWTLFVQHTSIIDRWLGAADQPAVRCLRQIVTREPTAGTLRADSSASLVEHPSTRRVQVAPARLWSKSACLHRRKLASSRHLLPRSSSRTAIHGRRSGDFGLPSESVLLTRLTF